MWMCIGAQEASFSTLSYFNVYGFAYISCYTLWRMYILNNNYITTVGSDTETSLYVHAVGFSTGWVRD